MKMDAIKNFEVAAGKTVELKNFDTNWVPKWAKSTDNKTVKQQAQSILDANRQILREKQELFWASDTYSMLVIFQGMDTAGKDSTIKHVMSGVNPQGCQITSFKTPSEEELDHTFLWREMKASPERGRIGIFNRSYYEEVLIVKIHPEILQKQKLPPQTKNGDFWENRYNDINSFERHLVRNGTIVVKFFLHVSKGRQKQRLLKRMEKPNKNWKFSPSDVSEREKWPKYIQAYEEAISKTSTKWAPWYIIPADKRWVTRACVSEILASKIECLNLQYPKLTAAQMDELKKAKQQLENEK
ncbi:MAG: polyphosphate kinase 2 family protein [Candidatus Bathyarchaeota archaeon]|nr:polyphosphate kinase 2 family protein [Candidatus Bathyarchaeota archaeon]